ncbi:hypothetical protein SAICODRAFT_140107 [Saitoella complicata NRRL Y-17804]|uniref:PHD-type domain-containing protein n=1 Tax=Saitoella complicata (strain BCRC 22490 / CBS 7301 / JCM 7358 / NBRC 10748 / NRRL Y-17804) TaxID=698492 RepID=A0A0E9NH03_SAICN|nr:uncharacterized protein SAICODRAFT_140107 [Saitoella complicata NRRL Y-17804]ODQ51920.1 hypothetical protein SAICODRAFT_140107 [Saitoella complicata NRRL Y-17804]GAO48690.1 hypothetical protein G7K_2860-t1 [Saitoella complicata NRRL Y-17804]
MANEGRKPGLPVEVELILNDKTSRTGRPWRNNLAVASLKYPYLFIGYDDLIHVYPSLGPFTEPLYILENPNHDPRARGHIVSEHPRTFNVLELGLMGSDEVLAAADDSGHVCVFFTGNFTRSPLHFKVGKSAWSISFAGERRLMAVSSNEHVVTVFYLGVGVYDFPIEAKEVRNGIEVMVLEGHDNNIPDCAFNRDGSRLLTACIDGTVFWWNIDDGTGWLEYDAGEHEETPSWSVTWLSTKDFQWMGTGRGGTPDERSKPDPFLSDTGTALVGNLHEHQLWMHPDPDASLFGVEGPGSRFCYCGRSNGGILIECDGSQCKYSAFHLGCVGLKMVPRGSWYCRDCVETISDETFKLFIKNSYHTTSSSDDDDHIRADLVPQLLDAEFFLGTTDTDVFLASLDTDALGLPKIHAAIRDVFEQPSISLSILLRRMNMTSVIPELNLAVVGTQMGEVCLVRLVWYGDTRNPTFALKPECILPKAEDRPVGMRAGTRRVDGTTMLMGVGVQPCSVDDREDAASVERRRWRVFMVYFDHVKIYQVGRRMDAMDGISVEEVIV